MRVTNNMLVNSLLRNVNRNLRTMQEKQDQLSTGKRVSAPSDDPVAVSKILKYKTKINELEQYDVNAKDALSWTQTSELAITDITDALNRARELAVQAANETNSLAERENIAKEIEQLKSHIIENANKSFAGKYIFSGYKTDQKLLDENGYYISQVTDKMLSSVQRTTYEIGVGETMEISTSGIDLFGVLENSEEKELLLNNITTGTSRGNTDVRGMAVMRDLDVNQYNGKLSISIDGNDYYVDTTENKPESLAELVQQIKMLEDGDNNVLSDVADVYLSSDNHLIIQSQNDGSLGSVLINNDANLVTGTLENRDNIVLDAINITNYKDSMELKVGNRVYYNNDDSNPTDIDSLIQHIEDLVGDNDQRLSEVADVYLNESNEIVIQGKETSKKVQMINDDDLLLEDPKKYNSVVFEAINYNTYDGNLDISIGGSSFNVTDGIIPTDEIGLINHIQSIEDSNGNILSDVADVSFLNGQLMIQAKKDNIVIEVNDDDGLLTQNTLKNKGIVFSGINLTDYNKNMSFEIDGQVYDKNVPQTVDELMSYIKNMQDNTGTLLLSKANVHLEGDKLVVQSDITADPSNTVILEDSDGLIKGDYQALENIKFNGYDVSLYDYPTDQLSFDINGVVFDDHSNNLTALTNDTELMTHIENIQDVNGNQLGSLVDVAIINGNLSLTAKTTDDSLSIVNDAGLLTGTLESSENIVFENVDYDEYNGQMSIEIDGTIYDQNDGTLPTSMTDLIAHIENIEDSSGNLLSDVALVKALDNGKLAIELKDTASTINSIDDNGLLTGSTQLNYYSSVLEGIDFINGNTTDLSFEIGGVIFDDHLNTVLNGNTQEDLVEYIKEIEDINGNTLGSQADVFLDDNNGINIRSKTSTTSVEVINDGEFASLGVSNFSNLIIDAMNFDAFNKDLEISVGSFDFDKTPPQTKSDLVDMIGKIRNDNGEKLSELANVSLNDLNNILVNLKPEYADKSFKLLSDSNLLSSNVQKNDKLYFENIDLLSYTGAMEINFDGTIYKTESTVIPTTNEELLDHINAFVNDSGDQFSDVANVSFDTNSGQLVLESKMPDKDISVVDDDNLLYGTFNNLSDITFSGYDIGNYDYPTDQMSFDVNGVLFNDHTNNIVAPTNDSELITHIENIEDADGNRLGDISDVRFINGQLSITSKDSNDSISVLDDAGLLLGTLESRDSSVFNAIDFTQYNGQMSISIDGTVYDQTDGTFPTNMADMIAHIEAIEDSLGNPLSDVAVVRALDNGQLTIEGINTSSTIDSIDDDGLLVGSFSEKESAIFENFDINNYKGKLNLEINGISFNNYESTNMTIESHSELLDNINNIEDGSGNKVSDVADVKIENGQLIIESKNLNESINIIDDDGLLTAAYDYGVGIDKSNAKVISSNENELAITNEMIKELNETIEFKMTYNGKTENIAWDLSQWDTSSVDPLFGEEENAIVNLQDQIDQAFAGDDYEPGDLSVSLEDLDGNGNYTLVYEGKPSEDDLAALQVNTINGKKSKLIDDLDQFIEALRNEETDEIGGFIEIADKHLERIGGARSTIGAQTNRLEMVLNRIADDSINVTQLLSNSQDVDMAETIMLLKNAENVYKASLSGGARVIQPSLLDFLR